MTVYRRTLAAVSLMALLSGCTQTVHHQGKLPEQDQLAQVKPNHHAREDVLRILGSPSTQATFDQDKWYYISRVTSRTAFFTPNVKDQQVVVVSFNPDGRVKEVSRCNLADAKPVEYSENITPSAGQAPGVMQQIFGNFGRFHRH